MGPNFDIVAGIDLLSSAQEETLWMYMHSYKPLVATISTPCKGLRGWSGVSQTLHPESWEASREDPLALGAIGAKVAQFQLDHDRAFSAKIPQEPMYITCLAGRQWGDMNEHRCCMWTCVPQVYKTDTQDCPSRSQS